MSAGIRVLELQRFRERLHTSEEHLLEAACLRRNALFQSLLILTVLENQAATIQRLADACAHFLEQERLDEIIHRAIR